MDRHGHQRVGLAAGEAEHHPLVAGAEPVERILAVAAAALERASDIGGHAAPLEKPVRGGVRDEVVEVAIEVGDLG